MSSVISSSRCPISIVSQTCQIIDNVLQSIKGLKALLCDEEVRNMLSIVYSHSELLQHEVVFVDLLSSLTRDTPIKHLKCVVISRPTVRNIEDIRQELDRSIFSSYRIFFTSSVSNDMLLMIANADKNEIVDHVEEVYIDTTPLAENVVIIPLEQSVFSPGVMHHRRTIVNPIFYNQWNAMYFMRVVDGLCSLMLTMNRRAVVRYRGGSKIAERIAKDLANKMKFLDATFPDLRCSNAVLLITDRMDDPCTPLLTQWTYEAMLHELIGIVDGNKIELEEVHDDKKAANRGTLATDDKNGSKKEVSILTTKSDTFFSKHRFSDWGTICNEIQELVRQACTRTSPMSFDDLKKFINDLHENKQSSYITSKHATLVYRLLEEVRRRHLVDISTVEQDMFENDLCAEHSHQVRQLVKSPDTQIDDALRLVILYNLRYESNSQNIVSELKTELSNRGCPLDDIALIDEIVNIAGYKNRLHQLYTSKGTLLTRGLMSLSSLGSSSQEKKNILMSHQPLLKRLINRIYNGELSDREYPVVYAPPSPLTNVQYVTSMRAEEIIIFTPGGVSYEEAKLIHSINSNTVENILETKGKGYDDSAYGGSVKHQFTKTIEARVVLASTSMVNSNQFLKSFKQR